MLSFNLEYLLYFDERSEFLTEPRTALRTTCAFRLSAKLLCFYWSFHFIFVTLQSGLQANGQTYFASDIFYHHFFPGVYFLLLDKDNLSDF